MNRTHIVVAAVALLLLVRSPGVPAAELAPSIMLNPNIIARLHKAATTDSKTADRLKKLKRNVEAILDEPLPRGRPVDSGALRSEPGLGSNGSQSPWSHALGSERQSQRR